MAVFALILASALLVSDPEGVVATAPATTVDLDAVARPVAPSVEGAAQSAVPHGLTTDQQIDRWIEGRSTADKPWAERAERPVDDRKVHSEVNFGIGTGGYRDYGVAVSLPLGENGRLDISYRQVENGYGYGYGAYGDPGYGRRSDPLYFDDGSYAFPGHQPNAAAEYDSRVMRPDGLPRRLPLLEPIRATPD